MPTLTPAVIGRAENAHRPILAHLLTGSGLDRRGWTALTLAAGTDAPLPWPVLRERLAAALGGPPTEADQALEQAERTGHLTRDPAAAARLTPRGRELRARVLDQVESVVSRAYGGVPAGDLEIAARVLAEITDRLAADPLLRQG